METNTPPPTATVRRCQRGPVRAGTIEEAARLCGKRRPPCRDSSAACIAMDAGWTARATRALSEALQCPCHRQRLRRAELASSPAAILAPARSHTCAEYRRRVPLWENVRPKPGHRNRHIRLTGLIQLLGRARTRHSCLTDIYVDIAPQESASAGPHGAAGQYVAGFLLKDFPCVDRTMPIL